MITMETMISGLRWLIGIQPAQNFISAPTEDYKVFLVVDEYSKQLVQTFESFELAVAYIQENESSGNLYSLERDGKFGSTVLL